MQLSAEETMQLSDLIGLHVDRSSCQAVDTTYARQPGSLLKFTYGKWSFLQGSISRCQRDAVVAVTQFWTAKKRADDGESK